MNFSYSCSILIKHCYENSEKFGTKIPKCYHLLFTPLTKDRHTKRMIYRLTITKIHTVDHKMRFFMVDNTKH